ncbi:MAG TPA: DoxX family protein [Vicinamibacterales bacterium]|nr:DoxX family protein [Vicinamibacterales bacterium]
MDRRGAGLAVLRICLGIFFVFEGLGKIRWFTSPGLLANQLNGWASAVPPASWSGRYLASVALPYSTYFARLVPLGELVSGAALVLGIWTPLFAFIAFFMALNFEFASGVLFKYAWLTNPYGLPVLGGTLALALGGTRLPWSLRRGGSPPRASKAVRN